MPSRFDKQEIETLLTADIFPSIHEAILKRFFSEISDHVVKTDLILKAAENRRTSGWIEKFSDYYDCLYYIAKMQEFYQENAAGFHIVEPKSIWKLYAEKAYEMDSFYRHFHYAFGCSLKDSNALLEDKLKPAAEYVEALYQNWYLKELNGCWTNAISDNLASLGYVSEIGKQRDFYSYAPFSSVTINIYTYHHVRLHSSYYKWRKRRKNSNELLNEQIIEWIKALYMEENGILEY